MRKIFAGLIAFVFAIGLTGNAQADWNYITLSTYYVLPGQTVSVYGNGFGANESVDVNVAGSHQTVNANGSGQFNTGSFTVPYSSIGQNVTVTASGNMGHNSNAILTVGTFYPTVQPNTYYIVPGGSVQFTGKNFGPNETVTIMGTNTSATITTDGGGGFTSGWIQVPYTGGDQTYNFAGQTSGTHYAVTIKVAGSPAVVTLNSYYGYTGNNLQVNGRFFGNNEKVNVSIGGNSMGTATANGNGEFSFNFTLPGLAPSSVQNIVATGQTTGKTASAQFTVAWDNPTQNPANRYQNYGVTVSVVSVDRPKTNISVGQSFSVTPRLIATGGTANNVSVTVQLLGSGNQVAAQQAYGGQTLQQNVPANFQLQAPTDMPAGNYTIAALVQNSDNSTLANFSNLGGVTIQ